MTELLRNLYQGLKTLELKNVKRKKGLKISVKSKQIITLSIIILRPQCLTLDMKNT